MNWRSIGVRASPPVGRRSWPNRTSAWTRTSGARSSSASPIRNRTYRGEPARRAKFPADAEDERTIGCKGHSTPPAASSPTSAGHHASMVGRESGSKPAMADTSSRNGGGGVRADRPRRTSWGRFTVVDTIGGCLAPGDMSSRTSSGFHLRARGGGSSPRSDRAAADAWARFVGGGPRGSGPLQSRDQFTLQAYSGHYVGAERGVEAPRGSTARRPACGGGSPSHADHDDGWHSARRRRHRAALATALELALGKRAWRGRGVEDRERPGRASHQTAAGSTSAQPPSRPAWGSKP